MRFRPSAESILVKRLAFSGSALCVISWLIPVNVPAPTAVLPIRRDGGEHSRTLLHLLTLEGFILR